MSTLKTNRIENNAGTAGFDVATIPDGGGFSMRNKLINGGFDIWQRGTSFTTNGYAADRWYARKADVSWATSGDSTKADVTATGTYGSLSQKIEDGWKLKGKQVTLSFFWEPISGCDDAYVYVYMENGEGMNVYGISNPTVAGQKSMTFNVPNDGNVGSHLEIKIHLNEAFLDFSRVHISKIQLEEGSVATPFEQRPIGMELSLCQRYYEASKESILLSTYNSTLTNKTAAVDLKVTMRTTPTVENIESVSTGTFQTTYLSEDRIAFYSTDTSQSATTIITGWTADAEL